MSTLIFASMNPMSAYKRLKRSNKKYLLRESRVPGMLTIDMSIEGKEDSCRFGFINPEGWIIVPGRSIDEFTEKINKIDISTINLEKYILQLLDLVYDKFGLVMDDLLKPNDVEVTRNNCYQQISDYDREKIFDIQCPISMRTGEEIEDPAFLFGNIYEYSYIFKWVLQNGTCPLSRYEASIKDIRKTNFIKLLLNN